MYHHNSRNVNRNGGRNGGRSRKHHAPGPNGMPLAAAGFMIISKCGRYVMVPIEDMKTNGKWVSAMAILGGKVEEGETMEEAANREALEETGANVNDLVKAAFERVLPAKLPDDTPVDYVYVPESKYFVVLRTAELADMNYK